MAGVNLFRLRIESTREVVAVFVNQCHLATKIEDEAWIVFGDKWRGLLVLQPLNVVYERLPMVRLYDIAIKASSSSWCSISQRD